MNNTAENRLFRCFLLLIPVLVLVLSLRAPVLAAPEKEVSGENDPASRTEETVPEPWAAELHRLETELEAEKARNVYAYIALGIGSGGLVLGAAALVLAARDSRRQDYETVQENLRSMEKAMQQMQDQVYTQLRSQERKMDHLTRENR